MTGSLYGAFGGFCVALLVYNLALWGALRQRFQLVYCVMVAMLFGYAVSSSGALAWLWPTIANNDRIRISYAMLTLSSVVALHFGRAYFGSELFLGRLDRLVGILTGPLLGSSALFVLLAPWHGRLLDTLYAVSFAALMTIVVPVMWRGWRQRNGLFQLFAFAWAAPIGLAVLRIAGNFHLLRWSFWLDNSTVLAMSLESLLSSFAVAHRIRLLVNERDDARVQRIAALQLADTDPLTGLLNRRAFLREAIGRDGEQTLLLADIDHFKRVNDTLGHDGGDEVLRVFARALLAAMPRDVLVARIGGEEFAAVTAGTHALDPETVLARVRAERMPFDLSVTASIGLCTGPLATETDWKLLYRAADRALFEAKSGGRDRARLSLPIAAAA